MRARPVSVPVRFDRPVDAALPSVTEVDVMEKYDIIRIQEHPELVLSAARWFHEKWGIPEAAYLESMTDCLRNAGPVPQWYTAMDGQRFIGGLGVIENDFHDRKDLRPNICAVFVEPEYRGQGVAGELLDFACREMKEMGVDTLYLLTDHDSFYERYGWVFYCMAQGDGEDQPSRMYIHRS